MSAIAYSPNATRLVIPAQAGIHVDVAFDLEKNSEIKMDSRLRGNDDQDQSVGHSA
jgi:hypothetical protein